MASSTSASHAAAAERTEMQRKTFTRWVNSYLMKRSLEIGDITTDFADGLNLINLLELLSKEEMPKHNKNPKIEIQKLENLNTCIKFITDHKVPLVNIGSKDIFSGSEKLILGLLWTLILRWEVSEDGKQGLLLWVQRALKGYRDIDPPNVQDFTRSWMDGLAFCGLIHHFRPDLINYDECTKADPLGNCEKAFQIAEEKLGIARLLDAQDVVTAPDEKSVIAYVSQFFKLFAKASKQSALIKSLKNAVEVTKSHDKWIGEYNSGAPLVDQWAREEADRLSGPPSCSSTADVRAAMDSFKVHMKSDKPEKQASANEIEGTLNTLVNSKKNHQRPDFNPEIPLQQIRADWEALEKAESSHERALIDMYERFNQADRETAKFLRSAATIDAWLDSNAAVFEAAELGSTLPEIDTKIESYSHFANRLAQTKNVCDGLRKASLQIQTLSANQHAQAAAVPARMEAIDAKIQAVEAAGAQYAAQLENARQQAQRILDLKREFNKEYEGLSYELDILAESIDEPVEGVSSLAEVKTMVEGCNEIEGKIKAAEANVKKLEEIAGQIADVAFSSKAGEQGARCVELESRLAAKKAALDSATASEHEKDKLQQEFANAANSFAATTESFKASLSSSLPTLEEQLSAIQAAKASIAAHGQGLANVAALSEKCDAANIIGNRYTVHTMNSLSVTLEQLVKTANSLENSLHKQILEKKELETSPEQLNELREVFRHFAPEGVLEFEGLRQACQGAGIDLPDEEIKSRMASQSPSMKFTVDDFVFFMLAETKKGNSAEDVRKALEDLGPDFSSSLQSEPELLSYVLENMQGKDAATFVQELFSR